ncbi:MAG: gliding motility-associated lipoprotein [Bacteroidetes bacterium]|nr:MAG: gliding motility-associated lipoprotein [Bacteroidota bacterium]
MKKKFLSISLIAIVAWGCGGYGRQSGELLGVPGRGLWFQPDPYGMVYLPMGSYHMGPSDQDVPYTQTAQAKTVSVQAFYMDITEITNNEYRQFVYWVKDSLARRILGEEVTEDYLVMVDKYDEELDPPRLNWDIPIEWESDEQREALAQMYYPEHERFYRRKQIDTRKLNFEYFWIDLRQAAKKANREQGMTDRSVFIIKDIISVYPDTLTWVHDFTYSFNEPMTNMYFWHPAYDNYPVVGITWKQARAFSIWRSELMNSFLMSNGGIMINDFRLPTESEWEYAARGGLDLSPYPWGGPYIRNSNGCFLANFKPMRGNYIDDGGFHTVIVTSYSPNEFGLYCMAGNVSEWTSNAFDESAYNFAHDLNPDYLYDAKDSDPPALKRKVIRGGSWKDIGYYLQNGTRTYEYQDTAKCYIGFRNVMTFLGRAKGDNI